MSRVILLLILSIPVYSFAALPVKQIKRIVHQFMQRNHVPGLAIDVIYHGKPYFFFFGVANKKTKTQINRNTIFEIGSITKAFTATLLALDVNAKKIKLSQQIGSKLPFGLHKDNWAIDHITFLQLATHTSGLPRRPSNFHRNKPYGLKKFIQFLSHWTPPYPPGTRFLYSNTAFGVLGYTLADVDHKKLWILFKHKIFQPLNMENTVYFVKGANQQRYAQGYKKNGRPAMRLKMEAWKPGAGALRSTPADMMKFLVANMGLGGVSPSLKQAMKLAHKSFFKKNKRMSQGLAWATWHTKIGEVTHKSGATSGFTSMIAFIPGKQLGIVVLANKTRAKVARVTMAVLKKLVNGSIANSP